MCGFDCCCTSMSSTDCTRSRSTYADLLNSIGSTRPDAHVLLLGLSRFGFLPARDPRYLSTVNTVEAHLKKVALNIVLGFERFSYSLQRTASSCAKLETRTSRSSRRSGMSRLSSPSAVWRTRASLSGTFSPAALLCTPSAFFFFFAISTQRLPGDSSARRSIPALANCGVCTS
jgi:hypothetical protein